MKLSLLLNEYEELKHAKVKLVRHPLNNADVKKYMILDSSTIIKPSKGSQFLMNAIIFYLF